jgi:hypothetical protein
MGFGGNQGGRTRGKNKYTLAPIGQQNSMPKNNSMGPQNNMITP